MYSGAADSPDAWVEPDWGSLYLVCDGYGVPWAVCTYCDMIVGVGVDIAPCDEEGYETLLFAYGAEPLGRTVAELMREARG